jgi:hypothetical protein
MDSKSIYIITSTFILSYPILMRNFYPLDDRVELMFVSDFVLLMFCFILFVICEGIGGKIC